MPPLRKQLQLVACACLALTASAQTAGSFELKLGTMSPTDAPKLAGLVAGVRRKDAAAIQSFDKLFATLTAGQSPTPADVVAQKAALLENLDFVAAMNQLPGRTFNFGLNQYSTLTYAAFAERVLLKVEPAAERAAFYPPVLTTVNSFDWRPQGKVTPVRNQYYCGSCWAFSVTGALESRALIQYGKTDATAPLDLSEQQLVDCVRAPLATESGTVYASNGCSGGFSNEAFNYIWRNNVTVESQYPYTAVAGTCRRDILKATTPFNIRKTTASPGYVQVAPSNWTALKQVGVTPTGLKRVKVLEGRGRRDGLCAARPVAVVGTSAAGETLRRVAWGRACRRLRSTPS